VAEYLSVAEARERPGLRLVLSAGVPGPWGEAAKALFHVKRIPFVRVRQEPGGENPELLAWTGHANAPVAVYADEPPRALWHEKIFLAERLAPDPPLLPDVPSERALMFGLIHETAGESGFAWSRRLMMLHEVLALPLPDDHPVRVTMQRLAGRYGYSPERAEAAPARVVEVLELLAAQLARQRERGQRFLVGDRLSALDLYWATFAAMLEPLPAELCPMPEPMRRSYRTTHPAVCAASDPALLAHRDFVYREYLELPIDL
jgi:glutathione S-transferase